MSKRAEEAWAVYEYREHPKGLYYTCYVDGYKQAEKDTIERACDTLFSMLPIIVSYYNEDIHEHADRSDFIKAFRKAMEEEK